MFTVTSSRGDRGYTREVWTWSRDMGEGGSEGGQVCIDCSQWLLVFYLESNDV